MDTMRLSKTNPLFDYFSSIASWLDEGCGWSRTIRCAFRQGTRFHQDRRLSDHRYRMETRIRLHQYHARCVSIRLFRDARWHFKEKSNFCFDSSLAEMPNKLLMPTMLKICWSMNIYEYKGKIFNLCHMWKLKTEINMCYVQNNE